MCCACVLLLAHSRGRGEGLSNPNDLKNILTDAARYRWLRENTAVACFEFLDGNETPADLDEYVDGEIAIE